MNKYTFKVDMVGENLDAAKVVEGLQSHLDQQHTQNTSTVKSDGIKKFSEQGYKVWRARVTGVLQNRQVTLTTTRSRRSNPASGLDI